MKPNNNARPSGRPDSAPAIGNPAPEFAPKHRDGGDLPRNPRTPRELRVTMFGFGFVLTLHGQYVALSTVARIKPDPTEGGAVCFDKHGNRIAIIHWPPLPQVEGQA